jgi:hypothetical protein
MRKYLHLLVFTFAPLLGTAQVQTFSHTQMGKIDRFISKSDTIRLSEYTNANDKTSRREISVNNIIYKIVVKETKSGPVKIMTDAAGDTLVTIPLRGNERNNIRFTDGRELKWQSTGKTSYGYFKGDKEAIKSLHYMMNKQKYFVVQAYDTTITDTIIPAIALDYWTSTSHGYHNKKKTTAVLMTVGFSSALALFRLAMDDSDDDF